MTVSIAKRRIPLPSFRYSAEQERPASPDRAFPYDQRGSNPAIHTKSFRRQRYLSSALRRL